MSIEVSLEDFVAYVFICRTRISRKYLGESGVFKLNVHSCLIYNRKTVFITTRKLDAPVSCVELTTNWV